MSSSEFEMSLERQIPVLMKESQMNGDCAGSQCGLTSLLPMSCRGRAAAFARDLHVRLRNLGAAGDEDCESSWLARDAAPASPASVVRPTTSTNQRDLDTFYDFELECESPSSPVDELDHPFSERSPTKDQEPPFYDVDSETDVKEQAKLLLKHPEKTKNGFRFSSSFYTDSSPVKIQPSPRENGHGDKRLYSAMTFEGCARANSQDEIDCVARPSPVLDNERLCLPLVNSTVDSDSEFESAKSDPSECIDEDCQSEDQVVDESELELTQSADNMSLAEAEVVVAQILIEEEITIEVVQDDVAEFKEEVKEVPEIITSEVLTESELPLVIETEPKALNGETKESEDEQTEREDDRPQRVRRCSSLKTGKTPPGTPGRKKIVRFADVLGLDLADVKTFMDEIPVIPKSAYDDLTGCDVQCLPPVRAAPRLGALTLVPLFQLPLDLTSKLETFNCCMETARVCDGVHVTICGSVRVRNLDFHKTVHVRYTMNRWKTYTDLQANYVQGSCDGFSDRFQFVLYAPAITSRQRLELAVRFQCKGQQFWDNNCGANYCFDCLALGAMTGIPSPVSNAPLHPTMDWHPSFY